MKTKIYSSSKIDVNLEMDNDRQGLHSQWGRRKNKNKRCKDTLKKSAKLQKVNHNTASERWILTSFLYWNNIFSQTWCENWQILFHEQKVNKKM